MMIPTSLLYDLQCIPRDRPVTLLMRHSHRFPITDPVFNDDVTLTEEGIYWAERLGRLIATRFNPGRMLSSPIGRCMVTSTAIARGAGWPVETQVEMLLSHPFIAPAWGQIEHGTLNGTLPAQVYQTVNLMLAQPEGAPRLDILVTHDTVVGAVAGCLLHAPVLGPQWPHYLEGIFAWRVEDRVYVRWRGSKAAFTTQLAQLE